MKNILSKIASLQNNKVACWILQILWVLGFVLTLILLFVFCAELFNAADFEYYGYEQWPWVRENIWIFRHFSYLESLFIIVCMGYSLRFKCKNLPLAVIIIALPTVIAYIQTLMFNINC